MESSALMKIPNIHKLSKASQLSLLSIVILLGAVFVTVSSALQAQNSSSHASGSIIYQNGNYYCSYFGLIVRCVTPTPIPAKSTPAPTQASTASIASSSQTKLHYTANGNFSGSTFSPGAYGFTMSDAESASDVANTPTGDKALVWIGQCNGANSTFTSAVQPYIGNSKVFGFYLMDEPDPAGKYKTLCTQANLKAESDWIHTHDSGAKTFIILMNMSSSSNPTYANTYNPSNSDIDLYGLDPYPCRTELNGCDYTYITKGVSAAEASGVPQADIVPVYEAFGLGAWKDDGGGQYAIPTASQEQQILSTWASVVPNPVFDYAYSWGTQNGDTSLSSISALQQVFKNYFSGTQTTVPTPIPTKSAVPTQSPTAVIPTSKLGDTVVNVVVGLHGIGTAGDSANPGSDGNMSPLHTTRTITVSIFNSQNQQIVSQQGTITYNNTSGQFDGNVDLGSQFATGAYTVKIQTSQYLRGLVPGIQTITAGQTNTLPYLPLVTGDINGDNQINILDYNIMMGCYSDLLPAVSCTSANNVLSDMNDDGNVNQFDYNLFLRELSTLNGN
jgi:hypothetical protein